MSQKQTLLQNLRMNPFLLAPMAGITDHPFRTFMKAHGAGIVISELVSATGLEFKSKKTKGLMSFDETQHPVGIQLFGEKAEHVANAAQAIEQLGADFVDLNFGCPVPKVVKKGAGSAMLKDLPGLQKMLSTVVGAVTIPVTIKIRTGWDSSSRNADEVVNIAYNEGITWVAIHGRTRAQGYEGLADWDFIQTVKANAKIPIIGNGDIVSAKQAISRMKQTAVDGVMIGRGALKNPFIFLEAQGLLNGADTLKAEDKNYLAMILKLKSLLVKHCDDYIVQIQLKKFAAWFATGYPGAAGLRKNIYQSKSTDEIMSFVNEFFEFRDSCNGNNGINETSGISGNNRQEDSSHEGFLMGGHG